jgi:AcrR family transcriptional regulator
MSKGTEALRRDTPQRDAPQWELEERPRPTGVDGRELSWRGIRTREALLAAAERVFGELGYHDASITKVTEAAGVAQGTFYKYFASKQEIFDELVRDLNLRVRRAMSEGARKGRTRAERERLGFEGFFRFTTEHPTLYRVIRQAEFVSPEVLQEHYSRIAAGYVTGLEDAMADGEIASADPQVLAWALMGIGEIVGMRWILWGDGNPVPEHVLDAMHTFIARGLGALDGGTGAPGERPSPAPGDGERP